MYTKAETRKPQYYHTTLKIEYYESLKLQTYKSKHRQLDKQKA